MNLKRYVEENLNCKINDNITEDNLKEFLSFMKVQCYDKNGLIKVIWRISNPYDLIDYIDFDKVVEDYYYLKVNDDCYIDEEDWNYFKESKYEFGVQYLDYTMDKFIEEYNDAMNDENFQDDFNLFAF